MTINVADWKYYQIISLNMCTICDIYQESFGIYNSKRSTDVHLKIKTVYYGF